MGQPREYLVDAFRHVVLKVPDPAPPRQAFGLWLTEKGAASWEPVSLGQWEQAAGYWSREVVFRR